jgi:hypothetical protein
VSLALALVVVVSPAVLAVVVLPESFPNSSPTMGSDEQLVARTTIAAVAAMRRLFNIRDSFELYNRNAIIRTFALREMSFSPSVFVMDVSRE